MPTRMLATILALGSLGVATLAVVTPIAQGASSQHHIKLTIKDATITSQGDSPGDKQTTAGLVSGQPFGHGVESITDKVTTVTSTTITFSGTITIYTPRGTVTGTIKIKIKPASNGGATGNGSGQITGGSGHYTRAHGRFTFTGAESSNVPVFVSHPRGTVSY